jgi:hypothetical protein
MTPEEQKNLEGELYAGLNSYSQQLAGLKHTAYHYGVIFAALGELLQLCPEYVLFDEAESVNVEQFPMEKCHIFEAGVFECHAELQDITSKIRAAILEVTRIEERLTKLGCKLPLGKAAMV